ncbi:ATP-grasp domain-containing protein [Paenibacillus polymyxa]|uniref:ATP-grasp domain-containing protein n=1 Tax=Paenibacillus polymyxa TaxID=1406 RepID=UPI00083CE24B|nr:ATP-grasp domain-containing protein [Paenibacillus polymyxa]ODB63110.1 hypothetical protein A7309_11505 [Paenibacillus polymyxa]
MFLGFKNEINLLFFIYESSFQPLPHYNSREDIVSCLEEWQTPVILKPVSGQGSLNISIIRSFEQIEDALRHSTQQDEYILDGTLVIEEYIDDGEEYSVEVLTTNGRHEVLAITTKEVVMPYFIEAGHLLPAPLIMILIINIYSVAITTKNAIANASI